MSYHKRRNMNTERSHLEFRRIYEDLKHYLTRKVTAGAISILGVFAAFKRIFDVTSARWAFFLVLRAARQYTAPIQSRFHQTSHNIQSSIRGYGDNAGFRLTMLARKSSCCGSYNPGRLRKSYIAYSRQSVSSRIASR